MNKALTRSLAILVLLSALLWGCTSPATQNSPLTSPVPSPEANIPSTASHPLPTPAPGYGVLGGRIVKQDSGTPLSGRIIYLGNLLPLQPEGFLITMAEQNGIRTITDQDGYFTFTDVPSGTYALILWSPTEPVVLTDPGTGNEYLIQVPEGESVYVGDLPVTLP